jgi:hypothetical protein
MQPNHVNGRKYRQNRRCAGCDSRTDSHYAKPHDAQDSTPLTSCEWNAAKPDSASKAWSVSHASSSCTTSLVFFTRTSRR